MWKTVLPSYLETLPAGFVERFSQCSGKTAKPSYFRLVSTLLNATFAEVYLFENRARLIIPQAFKLLNF